MAKVLVGNLVKFGNGRKGIVKEIVKEVFTWEVSYIVEEYNFESNKKILVAVSKVEVVEY